MWHLARYVYTCTYIHTNDMNNDIKIVDFSIKMNAKILRIWLALAKSAAARSAPLSYHEYHFRAVFPGSVTYKI